MSSRWSSRQVVRCVVCAAGGLVQFGPVPMSRPPMCVEGESVNPRRLLYQASAERDSYRVRRVLGCQLAPRMLQL